MAKQQKPFNITEIAEQIKYAGQLADLNETEIQNYQIHAIRSHNSKLAEKIVQYLMRKAEKRVVNPPFSKRPSIENIKGEFEVGTTEHGDRAGIMASDLPRHILVSGATGAGKTIFILYLLVPQFVAAGINVWIFSVSKREPRNLLQLYPDFWVVRVSDSPFKMNIFEQAEGVPVRQWDAAAISEVFSNYYGLLIGSSGSMYSSFNPVRELYSSVNSIPSVPDYYESQQEEEYKVNRYSIEAKYLERRKNRIETFLNATGEMSYCSLGWRPEEMTNQNIIWELDGMESATQGFLIEHIITRVYLSRVMNQNRNNKPLILVVEEGHKIFDKQRWQRVAAGVPNMEILICTSRAYNIIFCVSAQSPTMLAPPLLKNTGSKYMFKHGDFEDTLYYGRAMGFTLDQLAYAQNLKERECIVSTFRQPSPYKIIIDNKEVPTHQITDEEIRRRMESVYNSIPIVPRVPYSSLQNKKVTDEEMEFLVNILLNPLLAVVERYIQLHKSMERGNNLRRSLFSKELIKEVEVNCGRKGRIKLLDLTDKAKELLERKDYTIKRHGKGSILHYFWQETIAKYYRKNGHQTKLEGTDVSGAKCVDVLVTTTDSKNLAIEVALSDNPNESLNYLKDLKCNFHEIIFACRDKEIKESLEKKFQALGVIEPKIGFCLLTDYLS